MNVSILGVMLSQIAEKDRSRLVINEADSDRARSIRHNSLLDRIQNLNILQFSCRSQNLCQYRGHCVRGNDCMISDFCKQIITKWVDQIELPPLLHRLTQSLRNERVVLSERTSDD